MKFGQQFEFHKIPEWYNAYLDYESLKRMIEKVKKKQKKGKLVKLLGYYAFVPGTNVVLSLEQTRIDRLDPDARSERKDGEARASDDGEDQERLSGYLPKKEFDYLCDIKQRLDATKRGASDLVKQQKSAKKTTSIGEKTAAIKEPLLDIDEPVVQIKVTPTDIDDQEPSDLIRNTATARDT